VGGVVDRWLSKADHRAAGRIGSIDAARRMALHRLPTPVANYVEGGAGTEATLAANLNAVAEVGFVPRIGVTADEPPDISTTILGQQLSMPVLLSPVGFTRMMHPDGDVAAARAAGAAGTVFTLSSMSGHTMEEVSAATDRPAWFQLYFLGGRGGAEQLVAQARDRGFRALMVTMDTQVPGDRRRESRYGLSPPLSLDLRTVRTMARFVVARPRWLLGAARDGFELELVNAASIGERGAPLPASEALLRWLGAPPRWEDLEWIRQQFGGPIVVKGVITPDDARRAVDHGADAIVVSNHGGRQLDGVPATFRVLADICGAVGDDAEVLVDGGVRSGADVVRALALGAKAAMVGRAWAYGLCAAGGPGVARVLALLSEDVDRTLRLLGARSLADIDMSMVHLPAEWSS
jgi:isopentenyl diphosphate isomerase/L-lactate dehydrogenase-like FMN-dependent dehydrogenase